MLKHFRKLISLTILVVACIFATTGSVFAAPTTSHSSPTPTTETPTVLPAWAQGATKPGSNCRQLSAAERSRDPETLTTAERFTYGYPVPTPGTDFSVIDHIIQHGTRFCRDTDKVTSHKTKTVTPGSSETSLTACPCDLGGVNWAGEIANNANYTLTHVQWYVSCIASASNDDYATWTGIGGIGNNNLVQTGTQGYNAVRTRGYYAWVENTASTGSDNGLEVNVFSVDCNDSMFAEIGTGNCMYVADLTKNINSGWRCYGPSANSSTAEFIVERPRNSSTNTYDNLSNFGTETFYYANVAIDAGADIAIGNTSHNYSNMYQQSNKQGNRLAQVGSIGGTDHDTFTVTWLAYS